MNQRAQQRGLSERLQYLQVCDLETCHTSHLVAAHTPDPDLFVLPDGRDRHVIARQRL